MAKLQCSGCFIPEVHQAHDIVRVSQGICGLVRLVLGNDTFLEDHEVIKPGIPVQRGHRGLMDDHHFHL